MSRVRTLFTRAFWMDAAERAAKSAAQGAVLILAAERLNALEADWATAGGVALGMAALSLLTSIASAPVPGVSPASALPAGL